MRKMTKPTVIAGVAAAVIAGGGITAAAASDRAHEDGQGSTHSATSAASQADRDDQDDDDQDGDDREVAAAKVDVTAAEAAKAATAKQSGTVASVELDDERDQLVWEVDVLGEQEWHTFLVDANDGSVTQQGRHGEDSEDDDSEDDAAEAKAARAANSSISEVSKAALDKTAGTITEIGIDDDRNSAWEVEVVDSSGNEHDLTIAD